MVHIVHKIAHHTQRIAHRHGHEVAVAIGPLLVDFKVHIFLGSVAFIAVLYVVEAFIFPGGVPPEA